MKTKVQIVLFFLIVSCQKTEVDIKYYPSEELYNRSIIKKINLKDSRLNYKQVCKNIGDNQYEKIRTLIELNDNGVQRRVMPFVRGNGYIRRKNVLTITSDSIEIDSTHSVKLLKRILKRHYTNKGKNYRYSSSPERALVEIRQDASMSLRDLEKTLIHVTRTFDEVKNEVRDTIYLRILFNYPRFLSPPPPQ